MNGDGLPTSFSSNKRKRVESSDVDASLQRLTGQGRAGQFWRADTEAVVDAYLSIPSTSELAPLRRDIAHVGAQAQHTDDTMSSIRYAWHTKLAELRCCSMLYSTVI